MSNAPPVHQNTGRVFAIGAKGALSERSEQRERKRPKKGSRPEGRSLIQHPRHSKIADSRLAGDREETVLPPRTEGKLPDPGEASRRYKICIAYSRVEGRTKAERARNS